MTDYELLAKAIAEVERPAGFAAGGGQPDRHLVDAGALAMVLAGARDYLATLPKVKTVDVWRIECAVGGQSSGWTPHYFAYTTRDDAEFCAKAMQGMTGYACVRVTGPHQHQVPA